MALNEPRVTEAVVAAVRVHAASVRADSLFLTFVSVLASVRFGVSGLAIGTLAGERARRVHAFSTLAQTRYRFALVDVWLATVRNYAGLSSKFTNKMRGPIYF